MITRFTWMCLVVALSSSLLASPAEARWDRVKAYLQTDARVIEETDERIVLQSGSGDAAIELVVTAKWTAESDVYGDIATRRGGNPYRVWVISERLASDEGRPKSSWGRLLRAEFLRLLRPPRAENVAR